MFVKTEVIQFKGYNSNVAPELIDNGEARDIYNFRMEKIGKMVSRNGYYVGLFADACQLNLVLPKPFCDLNPGEEGYTEGLAYKAEILKRKNAYINNKGIVGIGELILSSHWNAIDTDRLMVYFLRFGTNDDFDINHKPEYKNEVELNKSQQSFGAFVFSPITGMHKNKLLYGNMPEVFVNASVQMSNEDLTYEFYDDNKIPNINTFENKFRDPQYRKFEEALYAPNKNTAKDDAWIDQYQDLSQYRHKLVVSDRINGDMLIQDEYSEEYDAEQDNKHKIVVRPNALETFDVNIVEVDFRTGADEENGTGIRQGMGLYNYELPKKQQKTSIDNIDGDYTLSDENWLGWGVAIEAGQQMSPSLVLDLLKSVYLKANNMLPSVDAKLKFLSCLGWINGSEQIDIERQFYANNDLFYRFTNAEQETEFYDALGKVQLVEEEYVNDKGEKVVERPADVYIWEDYQIDYFVSSGKQLGRIFLTDLDKEFTKATAGLTRIFELKELDEYGRTVPLGMWRYRFVWDFGNGVYSAPSAEMLIPDMLWSAIQDDELQQDQGFQPVGYQRPRKIGDNYTVNNVEANEFWDTYVPDDSTYYAPGTTFHKLAFPPLIKRDANNVPSFSTLGSRLYDIKNILYKDADHRFGVSGNKRLDESQYINAINNPSNLLARKALGDFSCMLTTFFSKSDVITKGMIYEGVEIGLSRNTPDTWFDAQTLDNAYWNRRDNENYPRVNIPGQYISPHTSNLIVPIFKSNNQQYTYNSIFDDEGRLRLVYAGAQNGSSATYTTIDEIITGYESRYSEDQTIDITWSNDVIKFTFKHEITNPKDLEVPTYYIYLGASNELEDADYSYYNDYVFAGYRNNPVTKRNLKLTLLSNGYTEVEFNWTESDNNTYIVIADTLIEHKVCYIKLNLKTLKEYDDNPLTRHLVFPGTYPMLGTTVHPDTQIMEPWLTTWQVYATAGDQTQQINNFLGCPPLIHYAKHNQHQSDDIYLNILSYGNFGTELYFDKNNADKNDTIWSDLNIPLARPYNIMRAIKQEKDRLTNVVSDIDSEALKRLLLKDALIELYVAHHYDKLYINAEKPMYQIFDNDKDYENSDATFTTKGLFGFDIRRQKTRILESYNGVAENYPITLSPINATLKYYKNSTNPEDHFTINTEIIVYGEAERLIAVEQLTSYFPSSLIHGSPRITFKIADDNIPPNAKNLLIFRTKNALDNSYQPTQYGLVDKVEINRMTRPLKESDDRDADGNPLGNSQQKYYQIEIGDAFTEKLFNGNVNLDNRPEDVIEYLYHGIQYFDKITDSKLDFSFNPDNYDGFRKALWSRFNANMYERNYYANFYEEYNPLPPMGKKDVPSMPTDDPMTGGRWEFINDEWTFIEGDIISD